MPVTLDTAREQFYLAQRASERFAAQLARFVANLEQQKEEDAWLEQVKEEAAKTRVFHEEQHRQWAVISHSIDAYVDSVKALAETMAVNGEQASGVLGGMQGCRRSSCRTCAGSTQHDAAAAAYADMQAKHMLTCQNMLGTSVLWYASSMRF
jgi:hypothetical protein